MPTVKSPKEIETKIKKLYCKAEKTFRIRERYWEIFEDVQHPILGIFALGLPIWFAWIIIGGGIGFITEVACSERECYLRSKAYKYEKRLEQTTH